MNDKIHNCIIHVQKEFFRLTNNHCYFYPYTSEADFKLEIDDYCWFCKKISDRPQNRRLCEKKRLLLLRGALQTKEAVFSECHAGIGEFVVPVVHKKSVIGMFVVYTIPAEEYIPNMRTMADYYNTNFGITEAELDKYLNELPKIKRFSMRPMMLLLEALTRMNIDAGLLPSINSRGKPGIEASDFFSSEDVEETFQLSYMNILFEGEKGKDAYQLLDSNAQQLIHGTYTNLYSGRHMEAKTQYDRLFSPALRDKELEAVRFNVTTTFFKLFTFWISKCGQMWRFYKKSMPIPRRIYTASSVEQIEDILETYFSDTLIYVQQGAESNPIIDRMILYIDENYADHLTLELIAKKFHISTAYASRLFKQNMGVNFKWYLNEVRMDYAYNYLKRTDFPVAMIAKLVGYTELRSFYKMFKDHFGVTCTQIRKLYSSQKNETDDGAIQ